MRWLDAAVLVRMRRVAVMAPADALRDVLVRVADAAAVEIGPPEGGPEGGGALVSLRRPAGVQPPTLIPGRPLRQSVSPLVQAA